MSASHVYEGADKTTVLCFSLCDWSLVQFRQGRGCLHLLGLCTQPHYSLGRQNCTSFADTGGIPQAQTPIVTSNRI